MNATRANWSASAPWDGITGKPDSPSGVTDIGSLTGRGFSNKQVPVWNVALRKFVPANISGIAGYTAPVTPVTPQFVAAIQVEWNVPSLNPLQSVYEDFPVIGAIPATPVAVGVPFDMQFCLITGAVVANDLVRLTVTNMNGGVVDLGDGLYNVQLFQYA